ncbi:MAG: cyclodeaminase/cyclohydrolase family protein [Vicinamibacterales bacterium]
MPRCSDLSVSDFLAALSSPTPTPGGGTAAAIAGAMGASLLLMVSSLDKSKSGTEEERMLLADAKRALVPLRTRLTELADADSEAFDQVMAAYRLPKGSEEEKAARSSVIQRALWRATEVPLDTLRVCAGVLEYGPVIARCGNPTAASDVGVGVRLIEAAAGGAEANVRINLAGIRDEGLKADAERDATRYMERTLACTAAARKLLAN